MPPTNKIIIVKNIQFKLEKQTVTPVQQAAPTKAKVAMMSTHINGLNGLTALVHGLIGLENPDVKQRRFSYTQLL